MIYLSPNSHLHRRNTCFIYLCNFNLSQWKIHLWPKNQFIFNHSIYPKIPLFNHLCLLFFAIPNLYKFWKQFFYDRKLFYNLYLKNLFFPNKLNFNIPGKLFILLYNCGDQNHQLFSRSFTQNNLICLNLSVLPIH